MPHGPVQELDKNSLIRQRLFGTRQSALAKYHGIVTGRKGMLSLLRYELTTMLLGLMPGAVGIVLRRFAYRGLFGACGKGLVLGRSVTVRYPENIHIGNNVVIDDYCVLDGRGADQNGIRIGDDVIISRACTIQSKYGDIYIGAGANIGAGTLIVSMGGVEIGESALLAGHCSVSGGQYHTEALDQPIMHQGVFTRGPIRIGEHSWLGMKVLVLDSVTIGRGCVVGSGGVVTADLPDETISVGVPARVVKHRAEEIASRPPVPATSPEKATT